MRVVVVVIAALMTLGLAAFGVVAAQKAAGPTSIVALATRVISPAKATSAPAPVAQTAQLQNAQPASAPHVAPMPVIKVADTVQIPDSVQATDKIPVAEKTSGTVAIAVPAAAPAPAALIVLAQNPPPALPPAPAPAPTPSPAPAKAASTCSNPDALGLSRTVQIDTTGGPAFGTEHFKQYDFLKDKEVVLTFDDGPWPENTPMVIKALTDNCTKATFFEIGEHATWRPDISREVAAAGMTIGSHTWSHKDLARNPYAKDIEQAKQEIEMGVSAVHMAVGGPIAPFFRFPDLQMPADLMTYLGTRNIATFSTDLDSFDFKIHKPEEVVKSVMTKLAKNGKGIILMHDFQKATAEAMPELLHQLKANGYKVVHMVPKAPVETIAKYDDMVKAQDKYSSTNNTRPESSVVKTINE